MLKIVLINVIMWTLSFFIFAEPVLPCQEFGKDMASMWPESILYFFYFFIQIMMYKIHKFLLMLGC